MGERSRPRDLYDIINLFRRDDLRSQPEVIRQVLIEKCESKGVPVPSFAALAYFILQFAIIARHGPQSLLARALGRDWKGKISLVVFWVAIPLSFVSSWISNALNIVVALVWLIPDRRIERVLQESAENQAPTAPGHHWAALPASPPSPTPSGAGDRAVGFVGGTVVADIGREARR